ncbi:hypothetical protein BH23BAC1_BH23BAC1_34410 [soil metagenome]
MLFVRLILFFLLIFHFHFPLYAQKINASYRLNIKKASSPILIDGEFNEEAWHDAEVATDFYMILPMDTSYARVRTDVRMTYDDQNLYLMVINFHAVPGPYIVESLRRDFSFGKNDNFLLFMDPFDDQTNGFSFGANAAGAQWDGIMFEGGSVDLSWDNKWISEVKNYDDKWIFEAAIPFKSIRYKKGIKEWGINFSRLDLKTTEKSSWAPVPRQFPSAALAYTGTLVWDTPPPPAGPNISLIPYALGGFNKNFFQENTENYRGDVGLDAKIALSSSLNLDLTVNPDFSQVEVDRQVTNLDRFELFFPERRQFFLENGDLFANFGYQTIRPFFSRRIGLGVPITYGARLSGKINKDWRVGLMNIQTGKVDDILLPSQNFSVLALQRQVFARSNISAIIINKESINYTPSLDPNRPVYSSFHRNAGIEYNLASANNIWTGKFMALKSFDPGSSGRDMVIAGNLRYFSRHWLLNWRHEYVGSGYTAEVGFVPRRGYIRINPQIGYLFFPRGTRILSHGPSFTSSNFFDESMKTTDNENYLTYGITFRSQSKLNAWVAHDYVKLLAPFDPTNLGGDTLVTGSRHIWNSTGMEFVSKPQSLFTYNLSSRYGGYFANGTRFNFMGEIGYRFQPYVSIAVAASYNDIQLPERWGHTTFWLVGPRIDVTLTNKIFFTAFAQYNEQIRNINLNTRFQWRFKPASDLFIVYTDNYLPAPLSVINRALVIKFTYWWNV